MLQETLYRLHTDVISYMVISSVQPSSDSSA